MNKKTLVLSLTALLMCTLLAVGGTYALFTGEATYNHVISAGNLTVRFEELSVTINTLGSDGYMHEDVTTHPEPLDLTGTQRELMLGNFAPGSYCETKVVVGNAGSTAFDYWFDFDVTNANGVEENGDYVALKEQIHVTITDVTDEQSPNVVYSKSLADADEAAREYMNALAANDAQNARTYTVRFDFLDSASNNLAQGAGMNVLLLLHAVQKTNA